MTLDLFPSTAQRAPHLSGGNVSPELPARPACMGQQGNIQCTCARWSAKERNACTASRYLWMLAQTIADMPTNESRRATMRFIEQHKGIPFAKQVRAAAMELIAEQTKMAA